MMDSGTARARRADFLRGTAAVGSGLALAGVGTLDARAASKRDTALAREARSILDTLLVLERLTAALYYGGLTSYSIMRSSELAGASGNPNNPGLPPGGNPQQVRYLQAALDAEIKHGAALERSSASSSYTRFHFPVETFQRLGSAASRASFLGVVDTLETVCVGAYAAAAVEFIRLGRPDLAETSAQIMGVESEHRTLGRVVGNIIPANSHTLETTPFDTVGQALTEINPFLTGTHYLFASGPTRTLAMPSQQQAAAVIGTHGTRLVPNFALNVKGGRT